MDTLNELEGADSVGVARTLAAKPEVSLKVTGPDWAGGGTLKGGRDPAMRLVCLLGTGWRERGTFSPASEGVFKWLSGQSVYGFPGAGPWLG